MIARERLWPRWWVWLVVIALAGLLAWAYGLALGRSIGLAVLAIGLLLIVVLLAMTAPVIEVTDETLRVGAATVPRVVIVSAHVMTRDDIMRARGPGSDARLYVELRPWAATGGVMVRLHDADDPHPGWLFSSRHPDSLVRALSDTMGANDDQRGA